MTPSTRYVYILECADESLYTGITTDLQQRVHQHNSDKLGAKYTKARRPVQLVRSCKVKDRSEATQEELRIKKLSRKEKIQLITENKE